MSRLTSVLIFVFLIVSLFGCRKKKTDGLSEETIQVDGRTREYLQYLPEDWEHQLDLPVLFVLHGGNVGTPENTMNGIDFRDLADQDKFILIYPAGVDKNWNDGRPTDANLQGVDDVNFFRELIAKLVSKYSVDTNAIFATGISNGGFMSSRLGCELSDKIAAIAVVAATMEENTVYANCAPANNVSAIYIHGTADQIVPISGGEMTEGDGGFVVSHQQAVSKWVQINQTETTPVITDLPNTTDDGTTITSYQYLSGNNGTDVVGYIIENGGHTWPQSSGLQLAFIVGLTSRDMNANQVIWDFFKDHKRN